MTINKNIILLLVVALALGTWFTFGSGEDDFDKRRVCHQDASGNEFVFYSPTLGACVEYYCYYKKMNPDEWADPMEITPGCEIVDFYTDKLYKAFGCADERDCATRLEEFK